MKKISIFTNIPSHYRASLWSLLLKNTNCEFNFFYGVNLKSGIHTIDFLSEEFKGYQNRLHKLKNYWIKNNMLIWQSGVINRCLWNKHNITVFLGDMYCLSTWIGVIISRLRGVKIVFWGHGIYGNESNLKLFFRKNFYRLAHKHLLYERRGKTIMQEYGFNQDNLYVVFNSLDYEMHKTLRTKFNKFNKQDVFPFFYNCSLPIIVFIGRLTAVKKIDMLIDAVMQINAESVIANLIIIGDGTEKNGLEVKGKIGCEKKWLYFTGACYNEETICKYLSLADLCVSPGNVGLTAIHSLSMGTPVATHNNFFNQMPEAESITDGHNGFLFNEDDVSDLVKKTENWLQTNTNREKVRQQCYKIIDKYYNPNYQLTVFNRLINMEKPEI